MKVDQAKIKTPPASLRKSVSKENSRVGLYKSETTGEYYKFSIDKLIPFKNQARTQFNEDTIISLAETIKKHGIRQPLTVVPSPDQEGKYEIVSGERRYRAAILAELERVPCLIISDYSQAEEIALIENTQREDLHPIELGQVFCNILDRDICSSTSALAIKLSLSKSKIVECIGYTKLPEQVKNTLIKNKITTRSLLRDLIKCSTVDSMWERIKIDTVAKNPIKLTNKTYLRSINSLFALTRGGKDLIFKANVFQKLDSKRKNQVINEIEVILKSLKNE